MAVPVIAPDAEPPFDVVILSQNEYLRALLGSRFALPFDTYLGKLNTESSKAASRTASQLALRIASMPEAPQNVQDDRTLRAEGAKLFKAAQVLTGFQQTTKLLENMSKTPDQILQGMVLDLFG